MSERVAQNPAATPSESAMVNEPQGSKRGAPWALVLGLSAAIIGLGLLALVFVAGAHQEPTTLQVVGHSWRREIDVERFACPDVASGAKCDQSAMTWTRVRAVSASGSTLMPTPRWPEPDIASQGQCDGCERIAGRRETYTVRFRYGGQRETSCDVEQTRWARFALGSEWIAKRSESGAVDCAALQKK